MSRGIYFDRTQVEDIVYQLQIAMSNLSEYPDEERSNSAQIARLVKIQNKLDALIASRRSKFYIRL